MTPLEIYVLIQLLLELLAHAPAEVEAIAAGVAKITASPNGVTKAAAAAETASAVLGELNKTLDGMSGKGSN